MRIFTWQCLGLVGEYIWMAVVGPAGEDISIAALSLAGDDIWMAVLGPAAEDI